MCAPVCEDIHVSVLESTQSPHWTLDLAHRRHAAKMSRDHESNKEIMRPPKSAVVPRQISTGRACRNGRVLAAPSDRQPRERRRCPHVAIPASQVSALSLQTAPCRDRAKGLQRRSLVGPRQDAHMKTETHFLHKDWTSAVSKGRTAGIPEQTPDEYARPRTRCPVDHRCKHLHLCARVLVWSSECSHALCARNVTTPTRQQKATNDVKLVGVVSALPPKLFRTTFRTIHVFYVTLTAPPQSAPRYHQSSKAELLPKCAHCCCENIVPCYCCRQANGL